MKSTLLILVTMVLAKVYSQDYQGTREYTESTQINTKISNKDKSKLLKAYSLNYCLYNNYRRINFKAVSSFNDYSDLKFSDSINAKGKTLDSLRNFIISKTSTFYTKGTNYYSENGKTNLIFYDCFNFYESKKLKTFIKKLLKKE